VIKGKTPVLGTARDLHFANYVLDAAPGRNAAADFVFISSGAVAVSSGPLGAWDASALSGWQTLRLTAIDQVQNVAVLTLSVFVGDPATAMLLGNHEVFNMPTGVAVGADGKIYAADRDDDRIAVFTSTGGLTASFGGRLGDHEDGDKVSTSTLRLSEPSGVAVDAAGDVFVADTNHHRVLKLSPAGQVLLDLGRRETGRDGGEGKTEFDLGRGPGEFNHPEGVAVDAAGRLYVADTDNGRVQVFTSTGGLAAQFDLPALPPPQAVAPGDEDREPREKGADESPSRGRPVGIALDAAGNIYVADSAGHRALRFDPSGHLTLAIPIPGDKPGQTGRPYGVAVSAGGECLLVSDQRFGHVLKFDALGAQNLSFGVKERGVDGKPKPGGIPLRKPAGLALDASGSLFVVDRNAEKIEKFGLPNGQATVVVPPASPRDDDSARDVVDMADGGTVSRKDQAAVSIPALALADDLKVTVSTPTADVAAASSQGAQDKELKTASPPVDFGPEGTRFQTPVTLTLPFNPDLVALQGVDESSLKVNYWNKDKQRWEDLPSVVDPQNHVVKAQTSHFSLYQVFADSAGVALRPLAAADPTFTLRDAYAFPNPVRGAGAVTIRIQPGLADSAEVDVYDLTGRRVQSSADFTRSVIDDGNGKGAQYTFDHVWNVSGVGSGVYTYVITAKKAGSSDIHKSGKVGVIK
jgi:sugar lactone lactonase YvrE